MLSSLDKFLIKIPEIYYLHMIGLWTPLMFFISYYVLPVFKHRRAKIVLYLSFVLTVTLLMPLSVTVYGFYLRGELSKLLYMMAIYFLMYTLGITMIARQILYCWCSDEAYKKLRVPKDGKGVLALYPKNKKSRLLFSSSVLFLVTILLVLIIPAVIYAVNTDHEPKMMLFICVFPWFIGGCIAMYHLIIGQFISRCPNCNFRILAFAKKNEKGKLIMFMLARRILFKQEFFCPHCHAHYYLSEEKFKEAQKQLP